MLVNNTNTNYLNITNNHPGMTDMFESNADLSNMSDEDLFVSDALHKAFVEVRVCVRVMRVLVTEPILTP